MPINQAFPPQPLIPQMGSLALPQRVSMQAPMPQQANPWGNGQTPPMGAPVVHPPASPAPWAGGPPPGAVNPFPNVGLPPMPPQSPMGGGGLANSNHYAQQQAHFAARAEDKPWKYGPAVGGGLMRVHGQNPNDPTGIPRPFQGGL